MQTTYTITSRNGKRTTSRMPKSLRLDEKLIFEIVSDAICAFFTHMRRNTAEGHAARKLLPADLYLYTVTIEASPLAKEINMKDVRRLVRSYRDHLSSDYPILQESTTTSEN